MVAVAVLVRADGCSGLAVSSPGGGGARAGPHLGAGLELDCPELSRIGLETHAIQC